jgi:hypothetical protein
MLILSLPRDILLLENVESWTMDADILSFKSPKTDLTALALTYIRK